MISSNGLYLQEGRVQPGCRRPLPVLRFTRQGSSLKSWGSLCSRDLSILLQELSSSLFCSASAETGAQRVGILAAIAFRHECPCLSVACNVHRRDST